MLHCIQCEYSRIPVKKSIRYKVLRKTILDYKTTTVQYNTNSCDRVLAWFVGLFSKCNKRYTAWLQSLCVANVSRSKVYVLIAIQWSVILRSAFYKYVKKRCLWGVFSFKAEVSSIILKVFYMLKEFQRCKPEILCLQDHVFLYPLATYRIWWN